MGLLSPPDRDPDRARAAHLLRRTTLTIDPDRIERLADMDWSEAVSAVLDEATGWPDGSVGPADGDIPADADTGELVSWWLERMVRSETGLAERMTWFWHTLLTTNAWKVSGSALVVDQLATLRTHCLGDYRTLLQKFVHSGALLQFLDASGSLASNPNENLARELMELFTLGRGNYNEDDVRSAARALAGWVVEDEKVTWHRDRAFVAPLLFRGVQDEWDTAKVVDHLCDQPETVANVASRLWHHIVGTSLEPAAAADLGAWWQDHDLAILPLVERILRDPTMERARLNKARTGVEWYVAFLSATGRDERDPWPLERLGQMPYAPPNVGGWPEGERWVGAGSMLARAGMSFTVDLGEDLPSRTDQVLDRCGLHQVSPATLAAIDGVQPSDELPPESAARTRWRLALSSPEFSLS